MSSIEQKMKALDAFKDWSNYLLVTTVAAVGWIAKPSDTSLPPESRGICIFLLVLSIVFAILTLALIPHIAEGLKETNFSIYDVRWRGWFQGEYELMDLCLPQHVLFLLGVIFYGAGSTFPCHPVWAGIITTAVVLYVLRVIVVNVWQRRV